MPSSKSWKRYSATLLGTVMVWSLAVFWGQSKVAVVAISAIAAMVLGFIGGDSASKFAPPRPPGPFGPPRPGGKKP